MLHPSLPPTPHPRTTTKYTDYILLLQEPHQDIEWWCRRTKESNIPQIDKRSVLLWCAKVQAHPLQIFANATPRKSAEQRHRSFWRCSQFFQFSVRTCHGHGSFPVTLLQCMSNIVKPIKRFWTVAAATQGLAVCSSTNIVDHPERGCKGEPHNYNLD